MITEKRKIGNYGERLTAKYLRRHGYRILSKNYETRVGEIDVIALKGRALCFVEVKTRTEHSLSCPADAVGNKKQSRIIKTAFSYLKFCRKSTKQRSAFWCLFHHFPTDLEHCTLRFDIAEVYLREGRLDHFNYMENAFNATYANAPYLF